MRRMVNTRARLRPALVSASLLLAAAWAYADPKLVGAALGFHW